MALDITHSTNHRVKRGTPRIAGVEENEKGGLAAREMALQRGAPVGSKEGRSTPVPWMADPESRIQSPEQMKMKVVMVE